MCMLPSRGTDCVFLLKPRCDLALIISLEAMREMAIDLEAKYDSKRHLSPLRSLLVSKQGKDAPSYQGDKGLLLPAQRF